MSLVTHQVDADGICTLTLNDPDRRNAMGLEMAATFQQVVRSLITDQSLRAVILTGAGSAFSAGGDLEMLRQKANKPLEQNRADMLAFYASFLCILDLQVPIIAAVNGHAVGAGACVAMACDYRIVSGAAKVGFNFARIGLHPGMGATCTLPRIVGQAVATDLLVSGRIFTGRKLVKWALRNKFAPALKRFTKLPNDTP